MAALDRRQLLASTACIVLGQATASAGVIHGGLPWWPAAGAPPKPFVPGGPWHFFTAAEGRAVGAIVDRMIPPDADSPGGKDAGVADFIDRQLAGPFGRADGHYKSGPYKKGNKEQGDQSPFTPAEQYRKALAAIDTHAKASYAGKAFVDLDDADKDTTISALEAGNLEIDGVEAKKFFTTLLKNVREGYFADPIYGGNRDMASWRWLGFPGARYDFTDWMDRHNEPYPHGPIGIAGAPSWTPR